MRTYVDMTWGISQHGLPYFDNGPVDRFIALRPPFNLWTHGHLWGTYGPVFPYVAALPMRFGGLIGVTRATTALLVPLAILTFFFVRRLLEDESYALAGAILVVISTPALGKTIEISAYPLSMVLAVAAAHVTLIAVSSSDRRRMRWSIIAGVIYAAGSATHLLGLPLAMALLGALGISDLENARDDRGPRFLASTWLASFWPTKQTLASAVVAGLTMGLCTLPVALLNRVRFGSYNPFSLGPAPWESMPFFGARYQTIAAHLKAAAVFLVLLVFVVVAWSAAALATRKWLARAMIFAGAAIAIGMVPWLREHTAHYLRTAYTFTIDVSLVDLEGPYRRAPGTFANIYNRWATKATLQSTPLLALACLLPKLDAKTKHKVLIALAPCAALFIYLTMRGNMPLYLALGVPWVYVRYTLPAVPLLLAAAMLVVREMGLGRRHWLMAGAVGGALTHYLWIDVHDDTALRRQIVVCALPVATAVITCILVALARYEKAPRAAAAAAIAITCGVGIGVACGHDLRAHTLAKAWSDRCADAVRRVAPERFAIFGFDAGLWPAVGAKYERDVEYADIAEGDQTLDPWLRARPLVSYWFSQGRPVFFIADDNALRPPWQDVDAVLVDAEERIYRMLPKPGVPTP